MKKKNKIIITSLAAILFAGALCGGSTYALFTSNAETNIAVTAGKVNLTAAIDELTLYTPASIDKETYSISNSSNAASGTTFGNGGTASVSGGQLDLKLMTSGDVASFKIKITNNSNIVIKYRVTYEDVTSYKGTESYKLIDKLVVKANSTEVKSKDTVVDWTVVKAAETIGDVAVSVELPTTVDNNYQNLSTSLKFTVEAVQGNAYTGSSSN